MANQGGSITLDNVTIGDIELSNNTINVVRKAMLTHNITEEGVTKRIEQLGDMLLVQKYAADFLQIMLKLVKETGLSAKFLMEKINHIKQVQNGVPKSAILLTQFISKLNDFRNKMILLSKIATLLNLNFTFALQEFLGILPWVSYTPTVDGTSYASKDIYVMDSIADILNIGSRKFGSYLHATQNELETLVSNNQNIIKINKLNFLPEDQVQYLLETYDQYIIRYAENKYEHSPSHLVLINMDSQKPSHDWRLMWFSQQGDIVEAYHRAVFQRQSIFVSETPPPEQNMLIFAGLIQKTDSTPAVLEQDTMYENQGYSSKMGYASPQGFYYSILLARNILNKKFYNNEDIKKYLLKYAVKIRKDDGALRNPIIDGAGKTLKEILGGLKRK